MDKRIGTLDQWCSGCGHYLPNKEHVCQAFLYRTPQDIKDTLLKNVKEPKDYFDQAIIILVKALFGEK